jgi:hypothetical protein
MDLKTLLSIINMLKNDISSSVFNEIEDNSSSSTVSKAYNKGYKNALIEHLEELEDIYENELLIQCI